MEDHQLETGVFKTNYYPISVCDLNTKFNFKCYSDWSQTNHIALVSLDGIYIFKPQLNVQDGPFKIDLIRNPVDKFEHAVLREQFKRPYFDNNWALWNQHQYMEAYLDPALNTHIKSLSFDLYPRYYKIIKWSPIIDMFPRQCALATITLDYQLIVIQNNQLQIDLSSSYDKIWAQLKQKEALSDKDKNLANNSKETTEGEDGDGIDFELVRNELHSLSFCNACWKMTKNGNNLLLLAATIPGDIVIWQYIYKNSSDLKMIEGNKQSPYFVMRSILKTDLRLISSMQLFDDLLILASKDGQVVLYDLTENLEQIDQLISQSKHQTNDELGFLHIVTLPPTATLWHSDNIEVADFYIQPITGETFRIVLAKATNICWCFINYTKKTDGELARLAISDSFSAVDGKDPDVSLHQTPATWLKKAGEKKAVLIADDGSFFQLEFTDEKQDTIPEFHAIKTGKNDLTRLVPRGLCTSPNGYLITMISYVALMYEPTKLPEPTKLLLLPTLSERNFLNDYLNTKLLSEGWLEESKIDSPMKVCDLIDLIRSTFPLLTSDEFGELYKLLRETGLAIKYPKSEAQAVKLKIIALLISKLFDKTSIKTAESGDVENRLSIDLDSLFYDTILTYNVEKILENFFRKSLAIEPAINSYQQAKSLRNYFEWFNKCSSRSWLREMYQNDYTTFMERQCNQIPSLDELCPICDAKIPFVSVKYGMCNNGHRFDRCARSFLIIDLQLVRELECENCKRHYMTTLIWPTNNLWSCSLCQ